MHAVFKNAFRHMPQVKNGGVFFYFLLLGKSREWIIYFDTHKSNSRPSSAKVMGNEIPVHFHNCKFLIKTGYRETLKTPTSESSRVYQLQK